MSKVILKKGREESLHRYHPWVFSGAMAQIVGNPSEGDVVSVWSADGHLLGCGHYQVGSISVRMLSFGSEYLPESYWVDSIRGAYELRKAFGLTDNLQTNCYRLVHGEGDYLPGLIIDYYDGVCVLQAHSVGMFRSKKQICLALKDVYSDKLKAVYDKSSGTAPFKAGLELVDGYIYKKEGFSEEESVVKENGNNFWVNWGEGQKTGFFLDQRENRALVGKYACGRNVLNLFCYTGGFSIYALNGGAKKVESVDSSARAMALTDRNVALNGFENHISHTADAMEFLSKVEPGVFDMMIVDPPAFAKHRGSLKNALRAYQRLNAAAISKIASGGIIFTFSCSQVVDKEAFALAVFSAAASVGRRVRIVDRLNQPCDHAVNIYHPEGEYLKGLMLYVE
ncbi:MAG TPA: RlmI/RlmK family 23S rRNA methyltransferase [Rikenellaceae bacterium]|nr:RlmI/RlmK family 23S rRNA methyltransferase [Rikenellaceae bacterium]